MFTLDGNYIVVGKVAATGDGRKWEAGGGVNLFNIFERGHNTSQNNTQNNSMPNQQYINNDFF